jgi:hypothetical protein
MVYLCDRKVLKPRERWFEIMMRFSAKWLSALAAGFLGLVAPAITQAQVAGDTCETAGEITVSGSYNFDTTGASGNDPCLAGIPTVFYRFTAASSGVASIDLCGSTFDTYLTILTLVDCPASCDDLVIDDDDTCGSQSAVQFNAVAGTSYLIVVSGFDPNEFGPGTLNIEFGGFPLPVEAGDTCATAGQIVVNGSYPFDTTGASGNDPCFAGPPTVWYSFTPPEDGIMSAELCGSSFNTWLTAYVGAPCELLSCGNLYGENTETCDDDASLILPVTGGQTYYLSINGDGLTDFGAGELTFAFLPGTPTVVAGDDCETAGVITGPGLYPFDTTGASGNDPCFEGPPTVFYSFTAPTDGEVTAGLCGAGFETYLTVIQGESCPLSCDNLVVDGNTGCGSNPLLNFPVLGGSTYAFVVSGGGVNDFGPGVLDFLFVPDVPPGDTCEDAVVITSSGSYPFDTTFASPNDPCAPIPTVWFAVTPTIDGTIEADLCGSSFNTYLTVFQGPACPIGCENIFAENNDSCGQQSAVSFPATAGQTYYLVVSGASESDFGPGVLNINVPGIIVVLLGDANLDDVVNVEDVTFLANWLRTDRDSPIGLVDINFDEVIDELDVEALARLVVDGLMLE